MHTAAPQQVTPEWLRYPEAERYSGLGRSTLIKLVSSGEIKRQGLVNRCGSAGVHFTRIWSRGPSGALKTNESIIDCPLPGLTPEQARDVRAHAWAYVFSCWHTKQKVMPPQSAGHQPNDSAAKEVSYVEHSSDEASIIDYQPFTKENE
jgi:hypothetical protein